MPSPETSSLAHPSWKNPWVVLASVVIAAFILAAATGIHFATTANRDFAMGKVFAGWNGAAPAAPQVAGPGRRGLMYGPQVDGVVTAVNGNKLTVAGDGTTTEVDVSSSTQYTNASAAAVDDTVIATGTFNGNVLTATHVTVNP